MVGNRKPKRGYEAIRAAMRQRERDVLAHVRKCEVYRPTPGVTSTAWRRAIRRLEANGKLVWSPSRLGYTIRRTR